MIRRPRPNVAQFYDACNTVKRRAEPRGCRLNCSKIWLGPDAHDAGLDFDFDISLVDGQSAHLNQGRPLTFSTASSLIKYK